LTGVALAGLAEASGTELPTSRKKLLLVVALASLAYLMGAFYYAHIRPLDGDEGYYITAARLVWEGKVPYKDFSFPQGIVTPYAYSWVWSIHPRSLVAMRFLSAGCGSLAAFLWGSWLLSVRRISAAVALAAFAVVLLHPYWLWWNVAVKTFALANLLMSIALICLYGALQSGRIPWYVVAGIALGLCASTRSLYAPLVPFVFFWLLHVEWRSSRRSFSRSIAYLAGAACGSLPMLISFLSDPGAFVFNNVRYRSLLSPHVSFRHSLHVYLDNLVSLLHHTYFVATIFLALVGIFSLLKSRAKDESSCNHPDYLFSQLSFLMLLVYCATASIPFPVFDQYFTSPLLPFLMVFIAEGLRAGFDYNKKTLVVLVIAPILFLYGLNREAAEYASAPNLQLSSFQRVTETLKANSRPEDVVLSIWPGYVFESGRQCFPGSENQFNYDIASKITPEERKRYHLLSKEGVLDAVSESKADVYISSASKYYLDVLMSPSELEAMRAALDAKYSVVGKFDGVEVYKRR